ncbi:hypothetical protein THASP1DRAFT_27917 [Thamnocephalis sphaerospora]|uniref:GRAM domain-containing protein n=1 Tax=Thamnocephalis sphaerospora TaxID=78915 RepID=A0A4V1IX95_9FUNG|nr:hypothetical protein THASP1DRAFT_27917 [Thamnocephalis sphaerospora]|eukprot:RKP10279.1 hypothetical protein THASP1DRAFT_27917 [Thamnocephalis sphaerospora]
MALNWAMLNEQGNAPLPLPGEKVFFTKSGVRFELTYGNGYPGSSGCYNAPAGEVFLSNHRIVYLPRPALLGFQSISIPLLNIQEGKLYQPWFDANYFRCMVDPVHGGGLPAASELKLRFKEGGAFEFSTIYRQLRDRMAETGELAKELESLPAYSPTDAGSSQAARVSAVPSASSRSETSGSSTFTPFSLPARPADQQGLPAPRLRTLYGSDGTPAGPASSTATGSTSGSTPSAVEPSAVAPSTTPQLNPPAPAPGEAPPGYDVAVASRQ